MFKELKENSMFRQFAIAGALAATVTAASVTSAHSSDDDLKRLGRAIGKGILEEIFRPHHDGKPHHHGKPYTYDNDRYKPDPYHIHSSKTHRGGNGPHYGGKAHRHDLDAHGNAHYRRW